MAVDGLSKPGKSGDELMTAATFCSTKLWYSCTICSATSCTEAPRDYTAASRSFRLADLSTMGRSSQTACMSLQSATGVVYNLQTPEISHVSGAQGCIMRSVCRATEVAARGCRMLNSAPQTVFNSPICHSATGCDAILENQFPRYASSCRT